MRLFTLYAADREDHILEHGISFYVFGDDTQLYLHCRHDETMSAVLRLENCIKDVGHWMSANHLKLNMDKTEFLWARSHHSQALLGSSGPSLWLGTETVIASDQVCILGVTLLLDRSIDKHLSTGFVSSDEFDVHSKPIQWLHKFTPL